MSSSFPSRERSSLETALAQTEMEPPSVTSPLSVPVSKPSHISLLSPPLSTPSLPVSTSSPPISMQSSISTSSSKPLPLSTSSPHFSVPLSTPHPPPLVSPSTQDVLFGSTSSLLSPTLIHRFIPNLDEFYFIDYASIYFQREKARFFRHLSLEDMITYSHQIPLRTLHDIERSKVMDVLEMERWLLAIMEEYPHESSTDRYVHWGHLTGDDKALLASLLYKLGSLRDVVDEIYCFLLKMLNDNPSPDRELKGFEVLFVLARCTPPSNHFFNYCLRFCYSFLTNREEVGNVNSCSLLDCRSRVTYTICSPTRLH